MIKIGLNSVLVNDQENALAFYTGVLGFLKKADIPMGEYRWLTVVSPDQADGTELVLEPTAFGPAQTYQRALFEAGIPITAFEVSDIDNDYTRLTAMKVAFRSKPMDAGPVRMVVFEDTCGNLIQLYQVV